MYLRPETAQGIYVNFLNVQQSTRQKVPFGIAQIGKAFRNEITPGNFIFRTREFEQMEMQFFVEPGTDMEWFERWKAERMAWHLSLGLDAERLRFHQHTKEELAHYARAAYDVQFDFGGTLGFQEIEGVHNRGDFDLTRHQEFSGKKLEYFDQPAEPAVCPVRDRDLGRRGSCDAGGAGERLPRGDGRRRDRRPYRARPPSVAGADQGRGIPAGEEGRDAGVRDGAGVRPPARFPVFYDESGSIGRRYRRQDEVGTPFCITVDGQTMADQTVTIRDRDTLKQERIAAVAAGDVHRVRAAICARSVATDAGAARRARREQPSWRRCRASFCWCMPGSRARLSYSRSTSGMRACWVPTAIDLVRAEFRDAAPGSEAYRGARLMLEWEVESQTGRALAELEEREIAWESSRRRGAGRWPAVPVSPGRDRDREHADRRDASGDR